MNYQHEKRRADLLSERVNDAEYACRLTVARCREMEFQYLRLQKQEMDRTARIQKLEADNALLRKAVEELAECPNLENFE